MIRIIGFAGSLRSNSYNAALLRAAERFAPADGMLEIVTIAGIPLYDFDLEHGAFPPAVSDLKERIAAADGLLIATPEYNNSLPGVAKNAVDWLSRPPADGERVFAGLPVAVMGTSPGRFGTVLAQDAWLPVFRTLETKPYFSDRLAIPGARHVFGDDGAILDATVTALLETFVRGFFEFARAESRRAIPR